MRPGRGSGGWCNIVSTASSFFYEVWLFSPICDPFKLSIFFCRRHQQKVHPLFLAAESENFSLAVILLDGSRDLLLMVNSLNLRGISPL